MKFSAKASVKPYKGDLFMKKFVSLFISFAMFFCLAACTPVSENSIEPAAYRMEDMQFPRLMLREDNSFSLVYTADATRLTKGTYSVENKVLKLVAEDGSEYCFDVKRDSIVYNGNISDAFVKMYKNEPEIPDGTVFELWRTFE